MSVVELDFFVDCEVEIIKVGFEWCNLLFECISVFFGFEL